jgi:beta-lactam-binding protein with PASTA domain
VNTSVLKKVGMALGVLLLTFGLGYFIAARLLFPPLPEPVNGIAVPSLAGLSANEARERLGPLGLAVSEVYQIAHPDERAGVVVAQSPLAGQQLRRGDEVRLAVSAGPPSVRVPNVVGFEIARALSLLQKLGLSADQRTEVNDRPKGTVIRVIPGPGHREPVPGRVLLVISEGPPPPPPTDSTLPSDTLNSRAGVPPKITNDTTFQR